MKNNLKVERAIKNLTQEQLAHLVNVSPADNHGDRKRKICPFHPF
jgi:hypothetical protein